MFSNSKAAQKKPLDGFAAFYGMFEAQNTRVLGVSVAIIITLGLVIVGMWFYIISLNTANTWLSENRIIWAYQKSDGTFTTTTKRPANLVHSYLMDVVSNWYTYDARSVSDNFVHVTNMMDQRFALQVAQNTLKPVMDAVKSNQTSQFFTLYQEKPIKETPDGYVYVGVGKLRDYTSDTFVQEQNVIIIVRLAKIIPTAGRPEGLLLESVKQQDFTGSYPSDADLGIDDSVAVDVKDEDTQSSDASRTTAPAVGGSGQ
jgi:hypothetical protein